jgi:hypothetical protein
MQYDTKAIQREINVLKLSQIEYESLNRIYKEGIKRKHNGTELVADKERSELRYVILTDGYYRVELEIEQKKEKENQNQQQA